MRLTLLLLLLTGTVLAQERMTRMVYQDLTRKRFEESTTVWRWGDKLRVERGPFVLVAHGPEVWVQRGGTQTHARDERFRPLACELWPQGMPGLEPGTELAYLQQNQLKKNGQMGHQVTRDGRTFMLDCDLYEQQKGAEKLLLFVESQRRLPHMVRLSRPGYESCLEYESYQPDLPPEPARFEPPAGPTDERPEAVLAELLLLASPGSVAISSHFPIPYVYAPWQEAVLKRFGQNLIARCNEDLYEDLPPFKGMEATVPTNPLLTKGPLAEKAVHLAMGRPGLHWSLVGACDGPTLARVAVQDPDATDRASAHAELARRGQPVAEGLLDDVGSVRLLCVELQKAGDAEVLLAPQPRNPFQLLFLENALKRMGLDLETADLARCPAPARDQLLTLARAHPQRPFAALALYALGTPEEARAGLKVVETTLLEQGKRPDVYHSDDFWLRCDIIQVLSEVKGRESELAALYRDNLAKHSPEREALLVAVGYALGSHPAAAVVPELARVRTLRTENYDVYTAAANSLSELRSAEAFPALLHLLSLRRHPFGDVAIRNLEELTGIETPGKPQDLGVLNNLGIPKGEVDLAAADRFWQEWYAKSATRLQLDPKTGKFLVK